MSKKTVKSTTESKSKRIKEKEEFRVKVTHGGAKTADKKVNQDNTSEKADKRTKQPDSKSTHSKEKELKKKVSELEQSSKEWQDKYIRLSAEFDNYRKRTLKEKTDLILNANENLLKDILTVVDDFERGIDHLDKSHDLDALKKGIHLIYTKFSEFLKQKGIKEIDAKGQDFDIDFHEAMTKIPAPSKEEKGKVVDIIEKGYMLNDKVIRYAKVVIGD